jgi:hypothetical protein
VPPDVVEDVEPVEDEESGQVIGTGTDTPLPQSTIGGESPDVEPVDVLPEDVEPLDVEEPPVLAEVEPVELLPDVLPPVEPLVEPSPDVEPSPEDVEVSPLVEPTQPFVVHKSPEDVEEVEPPVEVKGGKHKSDNPMQEFE